MIDSGKKNLLGVMIDAVDYEAAVRRIITAAQNGQRHTVTALAVHGVMTGVSSPEHRYRLNHFDMVVPDGQPVRWGVNSLHGTGLKDRVYGPNLMLHVCRQAAQESIPIYLFGATEEILTLLEENLCKKYPGLRIVGKKPSAFRKLSAEEFDQLADEIKNSGARITFVGIGCPRQEVWAYEMGDKLKMPILAVGAAFAFHAGRLSQAPRWMQDRGLEWLYRLSREPLRLWKRYALLNPTYLFLLMTQKWKLRRFDPSSTVEPNESIRFG